MEVFQLIGYLGAFVIGMVMGITGSGGSAMAIPIFNYLFLMNMYSTTTYSLFVVGVSASAGVLMNIKKEKVDWQLTSFFALPIFITVYVVRKFLLPSIPEELLFIESLGLAIDRDLGIMLLFGILLALTAIYMITDKKTRISASSQQTCKPVLVLLLSVGIGLVTGITGTGGGFLIVPVLVVFLKLPIKKAIATSLMIIALKSFIGFAGDMGNVDIDWTILLSFTAISLTGMTIGIYSSRFIAEKSLKKGFGYLVLSISLFVFYKELFMPS